MEALKDLFPEVDQREHIAIPTLHCAVALSLTQPWATLMEIGAKLNETRSWPTRYRGWLGIHASKGFPVACRELCATYPFSLILSNAGYKSWRDLPTGQLLAVTKVLDCKRTELVRGTIAAQELAFGDYGDGRFAWITAGVRKLKERRPVRGALSVWGLQQPITLADLA